MGEKLSNCPCAVVERVIQDYNSKHRIDVAKKLNSPEQFCPFPVYPA